MAADDDVFPILGYNLTGNINPNLESSPSFRYWMNMRSLEIEELRKNKIKGSLKNKNEWERLSHLVINDSKRTRRETGVLPLIITTWDQGCYYNELCPSGSNCPCNKHLTGCVATAMAQTMKYYNYPLNGNGSHGYTDYGCGEYLFADFGNTTYNWAQMPNHLTSQNNAVATLMFHCGVSVDMAYIDCTFGSGASSSVISESLVQYFDYLNTTSQLYKSDFNEEDWKEILRNEINSKRILLYVGYLVDEMTGHAWVCDGFTGDDYFHMNWGWGGALDGYYYVDYLAPLPDFNFSRDQEVIVGIQPNADFVVSTTSIPVTGGTTTGGGTNQSGHWCTVTANPNNGYNFSYWSENGNQISTKENYSFMVSANRSLVANYNFGTPSSPGPISGITQVCIGQNAITYTVAPIENATSYIWTLPIGASGTSSTNSIIVSFGEAAESGEISVKGNNSYGDGAVSALELYVSTIPEEIPNIISQWTSLNPEPTGNWINSIYFIDSNNGFAVDGGGVLNSGGNILKTTDGGTTWASNWSGAFEGLISITFPNINTGFAVGRNGVILKTTDSGSNWTALSSGTTYNLNSVFFSDNNLGYVVGQAGTILKTIDGGLSWIKVDNYNTSYNNLNSIRFTNINTGYIAGDNGTILKTTDGGTIWVTQSANPFYDISSIFFTDANIGYAVARKWANYQGTILKTNNGGITWNEIWTGEYKKLNSVFFSDANNGYVVGDNGDTYGFIMKTTNAGTSWNVVCGSDKWLSSICFTSTNTGYAVGQSGTILKTINSGSTWSNYGLNNNLSSVFFTDAINGFTVGIGGSILKTNNGGLNWTAVSSGTDRYLSSVHFPEPNIGYAVGWNGTVVKTLNGGENWTSNTISTDLFLTSVFFSNANVGYTVDDFGTILKTGDGGANWITLSSGSYNGLSSIFFTDDNTGYAVGGSGTIIKTTDGGSTWTLLESGVDDWFRSVYFTDTNTGYVLGSMGTLLKTMDGGITWNSILDGASYLRNFYSVRFLDTDTGYVVGSYGLILKTSNGGSSWITMTNGTSNSLFSVFFVDENTGYTVGQGGTILKYTGIEQTILGQTNICQGQNNVIYTVPIVEDASTYNWTLPAGASGTSTTNSITVDYSSSAVSGNILVNANNDCGEGAPTSLSITVNPLPDDAGEITGPTTVCQGQSTVTYTVPTIPNSSSYVWILPVGVTGSSTTNSITVDFTSNAISGNITVSGNNDCGNGNASNLSIIVNPLPANAEPITGLSVVCTGQNDVNYSIPIIDYATSYSWSIPDGATGSSTTNSITVDFGTSSVSGIISVNGINDCGSGITSTLAITVNEIPDTPIISENNFILHSNSPNGNQWYNQNGLINGATQQDFTVIMNGEYYDIVTLNGCISEASNSISIINVSIEPDYINKVKIYPNPVSSELIIEIEGNNERVNFVILNSMGQVIFNGTLIEKIIIPMHGFTSGLYLIKLMNGETFELIKILKK